jgi:hypothetical protein
MKSPSDTNTNSTHDNKPIGEREKKKFFNGHHAARCWLLGLKKRITHFDPNGNDSCGISEDLGQDCSTEDS